VMLSIILVVGMIGQPPSVYFQPTVIPHEKHQEGRKAQYRRKISETVFRVYSVRSNGLYLETERKIIISHDEYDPKIRVGDYVELIGKVWRKV
jgi:hypothetical protein